jgi:hypothetical protein
MSKESTPEPAANAWSEPVNGLAGRVRVEFENLKPGLRHAVYLELRNHSFVPVALFNQPEIRAELYDSSGKAVNTSSFPTSGPSPIPQWAVVPRDAYVGFRIDTQTAGVPTKEHGIALVAVGGKMWGLGAGEYMLEITVVLENAEGGPANQWAGELKLPPVEVTITPQMLAAN